MVIERSAEPPESVASPPPDEHADRASRATVVVAAIVSSFFLIVLLFRRQNPVRDGELEWEGTVGFRVGGIASKLGIEHLVNEFWAEVSLLNEP
jgi:hypothetical protein